MSRKRRAVKRIIQPDSRHHNVLISKLINKVMLGGKKSIAETIVYAALESLAVKVKGGEVESFETALKNVVPLMEVKSRRVGGSTYQVPIEVKKDRGITLALRWLVKHARSKSGRMADNLATELADAFNQAGTTIKKREDTHRMAESNKAFAHFRW